jgi:hypothetical protein
MMHRRDNLRGVIDSYGNPGFLSESLSARNEVDEIFRISIPSIEEVRNRLRSGLSLFHYDYLQGIDSVDTLGAGLVNLKKWQMIRDRRGKRMFVPLKLPQAPKFESIQMDEMFQSFSESPAQVSPTVTKILLSSETLKHLLESHKIEGENFFLREGEKLSEEEQRILRENGFTIIAFKVDIQRDTTGSISPLVKIASKEKTETQIMATSVPTTVATVSKNTDFTEVVATVTPNRVEQSLLESTLAIQDTVSPVTVSPVTAIDSQEATLTATDYAEENSVLRVVNTSSSDVIELNDEELPSDPLELERETTLPDIRIGHPDDEDVVPDGAVFLEFFVEETPEVTNERSIEVEKPRREQEFIVVKGAVAEKGTEVSFRLSFKNLDEERVGGEISDAIKKAGEELDSILSIKKLTGTAAVVEDETELDVAATFGDETELDIVAVEDETELDEVMVGEEIDSTFLKKQSESIDCCTKTVSETLAQPSPSVAHVF